MSERQPMPPFLHTARERKLRTLEKLPSPTAIFSRPPGVFKRAIAHSARWPKIIAEIQRKSPMAESIDMQFPLESVANLYESSGVAAISVFADEHFGGCLEDLLVVRKASSLPLMYMDFIVSPAQLRVARAFGADAALLISGMLEEEELLALLDAGQSFGLDLLVEVDNIQELKRALALNVSLIGINNRSLWDFSVDLSKTGRLIGEIPEGITVISESGITTVQEIRKVRKESNGRLSGVLVGTAIAREKSLAAMRSKILELKGE